MSEQKMKERIQLARNQIEKSRSLVQNGAMRQKYHFMGEAGWINDPNGLIVFQGDYHFFYQYNPYDSVWGEMYWGHARSRDLIHWEYLPPALAPSESYDCSPQGGCFSGSSIEKDGKLYVFYTGSVGTKENRIQCQCMAVSQDGIHFTKYEGNPVIAAPPEGFDPSNFRDPKVWEKDGRYYLVCGCKKEQLGQALLYTSEDLIHWDYVNVMAESRGELGEMWECPDVFQLGEKTVFTISPMKAYDRTCVYMVGTMDYHTGKLMIDTVGESDWGLDCYGAQTLKDAAGRRIMTAWANEWKWMHWWKDWGPTGQEGWCGWFVLPREVRLTKHSRLQFVPVKELEALRGEKRETRWMRCRNQRIALELPGDGITFELKGKIQLKQSTASRCILLLRCSAHRQTAVIFDLQKGNLIVDRSASDGWSTGSSRSVLNLMEKETLDFHIFADQSSIEVFADQYQTVHSLNIYPGREEQNGYLEAVGGTAVLQDVEIWSLSKDHG